MKCAPCVKLRLRNLLEDAKEWLIGFRCEFCGHWVWFCRHTCEAMIGLTDAQTIKLIAEKVRNTLDDDPADRCTHDVYEAMDHLERSFATSKQEISGHQSPPKDGEI